MSEGKRPRSTFHKDRKNGRPERYPDRRGGWRACAVRTTGRRPCTAHRRLLRRDIRASAHQRTSDLGDDAPGASYHTGSTAHHALNPRHDRHRLEKASFSKFVAGQINERNHAYARLLVIAPAHSNAEIVSHLGPEAGRKLIGTIGKDLTGLPDHRLKEHIEYVI
ncbi:host attachment protein [Gluconacetobacter sp.]|uniref:host attachment protein n=1 Tax=Gluconacetobacter sp. TaxID=1935994 RepID=UPI0039E86CE8